MNPEHKRIVEMAAGWEGSAAVLTVSPGDALLLASVGAKVTPGKREVDPSTIAGADLFAAAEKLKAKFVETPDGAQPTPNQQSVTGPGTNPDPNGTNTPAGGTGDATNFEALTIPDLKELAAAEKVDLGAATKKAEIIDALKKGRAAK